MSHPDLGLSPEQHQFVADCLSNPVFEVTPLAGDASSRRYYRIIEDQDSFVLMVWEAFQDDGSYPFLNIQAHFANHGVRVPQVIGKSPELGLILLEDLGDLTLERKFWESQNQSLSLPFYKQAIDQLLKIHYPATEDRNSGCVAFKNFFNTEKLMWEMNYGRDHLLEKLCGLTLDPGFANELNSEFMDICMTLDAEDKYICHRDFHSRNVMLKLGKAYVIDFQDACMGPIQYDLVSLVYDSYVDLDEHHREEILNYYLTKAKEIRGEAIDRGRFFEVMRYQILQRCFKACGSFASFYNMREDVRYLKHIGPTLEIVKLTLENFPQYRSFYSVIVDHKLAEQNYEDPNSLCKA